MEAGSKRLVSPIVEAIADAEKLTTGEIRVHVSRRFFDPDPLARAEKLFRRFGMTRTAQRNGVLLYVNLRKRRFAVYGDEAVSREVGPKYWDELASFLKEDLQCTHYENAVAVAVRTLGATLAKYFPAGLDDVNPDELPNEVTTD